MNKRLSLLLLLLDRVLVWSRCGPASVARVASSPSTRRRGREDVGVPCILTLAEREKCRDLNAGGHS
jgi:hypothetical protein